MTYANIIVDNKSKHTDNLYTYRLPSALVDDGLRVGMHVRVPFGQYNKERDGYVFGFTEEAPDCPPEKIKEIAAIAENLHLTEEIMQTIGWMKQRYGIKYYDCLKCFIPGGKPPRSGKTKEPYANLTGQYAKPAQLTAEQQAAADAICSAVAGDSAARFLLHGVTASGKTEVYMTAIETCLASGKTAIMLVPEIALTRQIITRFAGRFGKEKIAVLHSKLTMRERYDEWQRIRSGAASIVIGARMGVFAPVERLGLLIMDEEHEATYKADMTPKYETVDIALKRLGTTGGVLVLGSATPSVVSYQRANEGIYTLLKLTARYNQTPLPRVELVDMRQELKAGNMTIFSRKLRKAMTDTLAAGKQIILFQNRRGYANFISCRACGTVMRCPECGISLTYHKGINSAVCHYCGRKYPVPTTCPECGSAYIRHFGIGTEQVEEAVGEVFPDRTIDRLDLDATKTRKAMDRILDQFSKGKTDILIGTQLVAKGLDFRHVGLVGVIAADVTLNIPDYRSSERTFQLITQVAGRAGRGDEQGKVIVQTYEPENYALLAAKEHDYEQFFQQEIRLRRFMAYPPFSDLLMVNFTDPDETQCLATAERCRAYMENAVGKEKARLILSPHVALHFKGEDYRYYLLIKCLRGDRNRYMYYLDNFNQILVNENASCSVNIDVNPYSTI